MKSLDKLNVYLQQARGELPCTMSEDELMMELGYQLMQVITPTGSDQETCLPMNFFEFGRFFEGATWHWGECWTEHPSVVVVTSDGVWIKVKFGEDLTYETADAPRANGDWLYECRSESS
jgi:hypothetical protein